MAISLGRKLPGTTSRVRLMNPPREGRPGPVSHTLSIMDRGYRRSIVRLDVSWPERPGTYRLTVDLLIEGVAWFADPVGEPLVEVAVLVE